MSEQNAETHRLDPGPELDKRVAELLGYRCSPLEPDSRGRIDVSWWLLDGKGNEKRHITTRQDEGPPFSSEIGWAWDLVEAMQKEGYSVTVSVHPEHGPTCSISSAILDMVFTWDDFHGADSAPHAICVVFVRMMERKAARQGP